LAFLKRSGLILGLFFLGCSTGPARAENAAIPYNTLAKALDDLSELKGKDRLIASLRLKPSSKAVAPTAVKADIRSAKGTIPVKLAPNGEILDFPLTPQLRSENPPVESNQPKGTLSLRVSVSIRYSGKLEESAAYYATGLDQLNSAIRHKMGLLSLAAPKLRTVVFEFESGEPAALALTTAKGTESITADSSGKIRVDFSRLRVKESRLTLPREPRNITVAK